MRIANTTYHVFLKDLQSNTYSQANGNVGTTEHIAEHFVKNTFISEGCTVQNHCDSTGIAEFTCSYITFVDTDYYIVLSKSNTNNYKFKVSIMNTYNEEYSILLSDTVNRKLVQYVVNSLIEYMHYKGLIG